MTETGTKTLDMDAGLGATAEPKKPSFIVRAIKKLVSWTITIIICVVFYKFIGGLQSEQKENFFLDAKQQAVSACGADAACIAGVKTHFDACIKSNYSSYKKGKYSRKYVFDLEGFQGCVQSKE